MPSNFDPKGPALWLPKVRFAYVQAFPPAPISDNVIGSGYEWDLPPLPDEAEGDDFSYYLGPLSADAVLALDIIYGAQDDSVTDELVDESYSFLPPEDGERSIVNYTIDDGLEDEAVELEFTFQLLEDAQVYSLFLQDDDNADDSEGSFTLSLQDDPVFVSAIGQGDGDFVKHRGVKPLPRFRDKAEIKLDEAMILIDDVSTENRVTENKRIIRDALAIVKTIDIDEVYKKPLADIQKKITKFSRNAAKHEGLSETSNAISNQIDELVKAMQARRKRQKKEEEHIILWLSDMTNRQFQQLE